MTGDAVERASWIVDTAATNADLRVKIAAALTAAAADARRAAIEECARLIDQNAEWTSVGRPPPGEPRRGVIERGASNTAGLAYADAIRSLAALPPAPETQEE